MAKKVDMRFQIKGVEVTEMELRHPQKPLSPQLTYHFNLTIEHKINTEKKLLMVLVGIRITHESDENKLLGRIMVNIVYLIENFDEIVITKESQKYGIPDEIIDLLNSISISTARGIMAATFKGTFLHNAILPVINPKDFSKNKTIAQ